MKPEFFFQNQMKPGDKVRIVKPEPLKWETKNWLKKDYEEMGLDFPGDIVTIESMEIAEDSAIVEIGSGYYKIPQEHLMVKLVGGNYLLPIEHFEVISNKKNMKITGKDLLQLRQWLWECSDVKGQKFAYAVLKNRKLVDQEADKMAKILDKSAKYKKYEDKVKKLEMKFGEKGANGGNLIVGGKAVITTKKKDFDKAVKELEKEFKDVIAEFEKQKKEFNKLLNKQIEVDFFMIKPEDLSEEITANQLDGISILIK